ncbi:MAG: hypothetical protein Q8N83_04675 [Ignavibacteria bacterium]|nr:hypothetical protein [Ignavibacteria bacterium]
MNSTGRFILCLICIILFNNNVASNLSGIKKFDSQKGQKVESPKIVTKLNRLYFLDKRKALIGDIDDFSSTPNCSAVLKLWEIENNTERRLIEWRKGESTNHIAISRDEENIVVTSYTGIKSKPAPIIGCYSLVQNQWLWKMNINENFSVNYFCEIFFLENTNRIILLDDDYIYYVDKKNGQILDKKESCLQDIGSAGEAVNRFIKVSRNGRYLVIWNQFRGGVLPSWTYPKERDYLLVWDVIENKEVVRIKKQGGAINDVAFSYDENNLIISISDKVIRLWSIKENRLIKEIEGWANFITSSEKKIVLADKRNNICVLNYPDLEIEKSFGKFEYYLEPEICPITITKDGKYLAFEKEGQIHLYETENWKEIWNVWTCPTDTTRD